MIDKTLLSLKDIYVHFPLKRNFLGKARAYAHALNGVSLDIQRGETLGIVGESGCGKSTLAQVLMSLLKPTRGTLQWHKTDTNPSIQIVFQDPQSSLDPRLPVWKVITEPLYVKGGMSSKALRQRAEELAQQVGIRSEYLERFPHEFSGGQRQRIAIARALAPNPDIIVLDEPTSALDISVQAQILNLLNELQKQLGLSYILISHNVSVVKYMSQRMGVMYLGQVLELGKTEEIMASAAHPYTQLLLDAVPNLRSTLNLNNKLEAQDLPSNRNLPKGCYFYDRCSKRDTDKCLQPQALLTMPLQSTSQEEANSQRWVRCWRVLEENN